MAALSPASFAQTADLIYHGGPVVTVNDAQPSAEAVAVRGGKIVAVGEARGRDEAQGREDARRRAVRDWALLPGFIKGHVSMVGFEADSVNRKEPKSEWLDRLLSSVRNSIEGTISMICKTPGAAWEAGLRKRSAGCLYPARRACARRVSSNLSYVISGD